MKPTRTRFAPSPTGFLHVGGIRTALFAWLVARQADGGKFVLRFEDTDQKREVEGARQHLIDSLHQLGLDYDEGPDIGGPHAPYTQSERLDSYRQWGQKLVDAGRAYADPYSQAEVQAFRDQAAGARQPFLYRNHRPENPPAWDGTQPLRFKSDPKPYDWHDAVMGDLHSGPEVIDDFVLIKSDGFPTYNFAHIVDDAEMQISHIMRGQEFLASIPNYLNLYEALELTPPIMATLPHVLAPDGKKKLSKRDGAKDVLDYIREGFLPDALVSFIATLGWNDGTEQEIFSRQELIEKFQLARVQRSGAHFDERRLLWINGSLIRQMPLGELFDKVRGYWPPEAADASEDYKKQALSLVQERLKYFAELPELTRFFFVDLPVDPKLISEHKQLKKLSAGELKALLEQARNSLAESDFSAEDLSARLNQLLETTAQKPAVLFSLIRIATTQAPASPGLAETLTVLGKDRSLARLDSQISELAS
jgi:glutamyl-tRNA synthetase